MLVFLRLFLVVRVHADENLFEQKTGKILILFADSMLDFNDYFLSFYVCLLQPHRVVDDEVHP